MNDTDRKYVQTLLWSLKDELGLDTVEQAAEDLLLHYNAFSSDTVRMVEEYLREGNGK